MQEIAPGRGHADDGADAQEAGPIGGRELLHGEPGPQHGIQLVAKIAVTGEIDQAHGGYTADPMRTGA